MTTTDTAAVHPLTETHRETLEQARRALAERSYFSRYPESPSPRVYGENAASEGQAAFEAHLAEDYRGLAGQPSDGTVVGDEVSPYGPSLRVRYPRLDVDAAMAAARAAMPAWRDAGALTRAAVCVEIVDAINKRSFEIANAVMHTSGQPFVMSFQAGGPHAQDRAVEAIVGALVEQERVPASVVWEKPAKGEPIRMRKDYRIVPRGVALVIGCNTFPTWNSYPGLFASLATGNAVVVKPHPHAILPLAISVEAARTVLEASGFDPALVQLAPEPDGEQLARTLAERPEVAIIDYTGGPGFGGWLEREAARPASRSTPRSRASTRSCSTRPTTCAASWATWPSRCRCTPARCAPRRRTSTCPATASTPTRATCPSRRSARGWPMRSPGSTPTTPRRSRSSARRSTTTCAAGPPRCPSWPRRSAAPSSSTAAG